MLCYKQLKMTPGYTTEDVITKLSKQLHIPKTAIKDVKIQKESIDARKKPNIFYVLSISFQTDHENALLQRFKQDQNLCVYQEKKIVIPPIAKEQELRPIVIGAGPAGLFCAYYLAKAGAKPILLERGKCVKERMKDVDAFWQNGKLLTDSNVQFGEGGAGTFSDGKLNTLNKDPFGYQKEILSLLVQMGAKESILYEQKPHIGTDALIQIVQNLRQEILNLGGDVFFESCVTDFLFDTSQSKVKGVIVNDSKQYESDHIVLAIGHSARDTFHKLFSHDVYMEPKSFAVGYRVQHKQRDIDAWQYGEANFGKFPPAPYKLTAQSQNGRSVYTFCMCPGGYVVNASSEENMLCINGMSYSDRGSDNANSAIIMSVTPDDFDDKSPLGGVYFQQSLEKKAFALCNGKIPVQTYGDYVKNQKSEGCKSIHPVLKGQFAYTNLRGLLPDALEFAFMEGMTTFGHKMKGYDDADVLLAGIEARTSSPVRISRDKDSYQSVTYQGLFPCGEGAGYAGGITSAATDGLACALAVICSINQLNE